MNIVFARDATLISEHSVGDATLISDPQPVGEENYVLLSLNLKNLVSLAGAAGTVTVKAQGSSDGQTFTDITSFTTGAVNILDVHTYKDTVGFAFVRFHCTLSNGGTSTGDWAAATFDIHGNFTKQ